MSSLNKVQLIGSLGRDPDIRNLGNGGTVANLALATSQTWKDKNTGERKERTEWHRVVVRNNGLVGVLEQYVRKGSKIYVEGELQTRKWQNKDGVDQYTTEVVLAGFGGKLILLGDPKGGRTLANSNDNGGEKATGKSEKPSGSGQPLDDDIPF